MGFEMQRIRLKRVFVLGASLLFTSIVIAQETIDLAGAWWFTTQAISDPTVLADREGERVTLPGSMLTNGKGDAVSVNTKWTCSIYDSSYFYNPYMAKYRQPGNMKFPFFLTPARHYVGPAWYWKEVAIPKAWKKTHVFLFVERPHIETTVYVNGLKVGHESSLSVPHQYELTPFLKFGQINRIAIQVYNGIENVGVGQDSHSVTDQTQGNWNGIVGKIELLSRTETAVMRIRIDRYEEMSHIIHVSLNGYRGGEKRVRFLLDDAPVEVLKTGKVTAHDGLEARTYQLSCNLEKWDEFHPNTYELSVIVRKDTLRTLFGIRDIRISGRQFYINNHPVWFRGTVENCDFPLTGYPPTDVESWMKIIRTCKAYGLNAMRFHSYCPPEAAFIAADILGFYLQPEGPSWPNHGVKLGKGMVIDKYLMEETKRIVDTYGNHPSFVMMTAANEPAGDWVKWCNKWVTEMKQYDARRVYCGASVGGGWAWDSGSEYHVKGGARGLDWGDHAPHSDDNYDEEIRHPRNSKGPGEADSPMIAHEQGQWCAFPDLKERNQYTGVYKAKNFDIFSDLLHDHGMGSMADKFLFASGKLQTLAYKYEIERNLRTKDYAGFFLLGLNDYSGQGTALVGPLNVFWREKGYVTASEWRDFCSSLVPLAKFPKFIFSTSDTIRIPVEVYHAGEVDLHQTQTTYFISSGTDTVASGMLHEGEIPIGKNFPLGTVTYIPSSITNPGKFTLTVRVQTDRADEDEGRVSETENHWDFWVYPPVNLSDPSSVYISDVLDAKVMKVLQSGGKVLLTAAGKIKYGDDVKQTYLPVFWNTSWFKMRPPHTTGAYIQSLHPVFSEFPTDDWQNLNWWELVNKAQVMNLSEFPKDYQPIVQPIDTWHISRKLGMLLEARVLHGKLLMTTIDITHDLSHRLVARQLRKSILDYMVSDRFQPTLTLSPKIIEQLFDQEAPQVKMYTKDSPDELKPKLN